jgi:hypothetical protein
MNNEGSAQRTLRLFAQVLALLASIIVIVTALLAFNTITPEHPYLDVGWLQQGGGLALTASALGIIALSGVTILLRYLGAALRRIRLDKNDIYFIVALLLSIATFLISHYWR